MLVKNNQLFNKKKILIIVQNLPVPFDRRVWMEATSLQKEGFVVSVICPKKYDYNNSDEVLENVNIFRYPLLLEANTSPLAFLFEFISCFIFTSLLSLKVLYKIGFKVIHICNPPETYFSLAFLYKLFGKKIIFDHHDLSPEMYLAKQHNAKKSSFYYRLLLWMEKMTFKVSDIIITTNQSHKLVAVERGKINSKNIFIVRSGPDIDRFKGFKYIESLKQKKPYLICYLGEMCKQDGVGLFLTELNNFNSPFIKENVQITFIGKGPEQPNLVKQSMQLGLESYVNFTGRISDLDLANYLYSADLCFDTSPYNSWTDRSTMNKIIEYMAFSNPVVAFNLFETKYSANQAGLYADNGNYEDFFKKIEYLLENKKVREKMAAVGTTRFNNELSWTFSKRYLFEAYNMVL